MHAICLSMDDVRGLVLGTGVQVAVQAARTSWLFQAGPYRLYIQVGRYRLYPTGWIHRLERYEGRHKGNPGCCPGVYKDQAMISLRDLFPHRFTISITPLVVGYSVASYTPLNWSSTWASRVHEDRWNDESEWTRETPPREISHFATHILTLPPLR